MKVMMDFECSRCYLSTMRIIVDENDYDSIRKMIVSIRCGGCERYFNEDDYVVVSRDLGVRENGS